MLIVFLCHVKSVFGALRLVDCQNGFLLNVCACLHFTLPVLFLRGEWKDVLPRPTGSSEWNHVSQLSTIASLALDPTVSVRVCVVCLNVYSFWACACGIAFIWMFDSFTYLLMYVGLYTTVHLLAANVLKLDVCFSTGVGRTRVPFLPVWDQRHRAYHRGPFWPAQHRG